MTTESQPDAVSADPTAATTATSSGSPTTEAASETTAKKTWVVLRTPTAGKPFPEYVEGTQLVTDTIAGVITVLDGAAVVRRYTAGSWANFAEWVTYTSFFGSNVIRLRSGEDPESAAPNAVRQAQGAMAGAIAMDISDAVAMMTSPFTRTRKTSEADGAVRTPTRLPGHRHA
jgi:hypothetical protein